MIQTTTELSYDADWDQCGPPPFHGRERAGIMWYGETAFMCLGASKTSSAHRPTRTRWW
jgi:hypothetical protein